MRPRGRWPQRRVCAGRDVLPADGGTAAVRRRRPAARRGRAADSSRRRAAARLDRFRRCAGPIEQVASGRWRRIAGDGINPPRISPPIFARASRARPYRRRSQPVRPRRVPSAHLIVAESPDRRFVALGLVSGAVDRPRRHHGRTARGRSRRRHADRRLAFDADGRLDDRHGPADASSERRCAQSRS